MKLADFGVLLCGVLLNAFAQLWLKAATQISGPLVASDAGVMDKALRLLAVPSLWYALTAYGLSVIVWIVGLSRVPVSQAYPLLSLGYGKQRLGLTVLTQQSQQLRRRAKL